MQLKLSDRKIAMLYARGVNLSDLCAYKWLLNKRKIGQKITIYYNDFQKWLSRQTRGEKTVSNRHASRVMHNLAKCGLAEVECRGYGRFEIVLFDLDFALGLNSQDSPNSSNPLKSGDSEPEPNRGNCTSEARIKQQQLVEIKQLCTKAGINYRLDKDWYELLSNGVQKVKDTLEVFNYRKLTTEIPNPCGWFRTALRRNYYLDHNPESPSVMKRLTETYLWVKDKLIDDYGGLPQTEKRWGSSPTI